MNPGADVDIVVTRSKEPYVVMVSVKVSPICSLVMFFVILVESHWRLSIKLPVGVVAAEILDDGRGQVA